jgi:small conductance mechanosensitive channel
MQDTARQPPHASAQPDAAPAGGGTFLDQIWLMFTQYAVQALGALAIMLAAWFLARWAARAVRAGLERARFDVTLTKFIAGMTRYLVLIIGLITCLGVFGVNITAFAAMLGAGGLAIGLGFQGALSNLAAGIMLLVTRPFKVGDAVVIEGFSGIVDEIELFSTRLNTYDNRHIIMPNSSIFGKVIENATYNATRRADISIGVSYDADIDRTREVLSQAILQVPGVLKDPAPAIALDKLGASSVDWVVRAWCRTTDLGSVKDGLVRQLKLSLDDAGISIPYPQMDVRVLQTGQAVRALPDGDRP